MEAALHAVVARLQDRVRAEEPQAFAAQQQTHPVTCAEECLVADAQHLRAHAEELLSAIRTEHDYYQEKAAALLLALLTAHEEFVTYAAELHQTYPTPEVTYELIPWLKRVVSTGHERFATRAAEAAPDGPEAS